MKMEPRTRSSAMNDPRHVRGQERILDDVDVDVVDVSVDCRFHFYSRLHIFKNHSLAFCYLTFLHCGLLEVRCHYTTPIRSVLVYTGSKVRAVQQRGCLPQPRTSVTSSCPSGLLLPSKYVHRNPLGYPVSLGCFNVPGELEALSLSLRTFSRQNQRFLGPSPWNFK